MIYLASLESRHFEFEAIGETEAEAINLLIQGLRSHGDQYRIGWSWWHSDDMRAACEAGKPESVVEDPRHLVEDGVIQVRQMERGQAYRDGQEIAAEPVAEVSPLQLVVYAAERFLSEGALADAPEDERAPYLNAIVKVKATTPEFVE